jgi:hypothetical protein
VIQFPATSGGAVFTKPFPSHSVCAAARAHDLAHHLVLSFFLLPCRGLHDPNGGTMIRGSGPGGTLQLQAARRRTGEAKYIVSRSRRHALAHGSMAPVRHARRGGETKRGWAIRAPVRTLSVDCRLGGRLAARRALRPSQVVRRPLRSVSASALCCIVVNSIPVPAGMTGMSRTGP